MKQIKEQVYYIKKVYYIKNCNSNMYLSRVGKYSDFWVYNLKYIALFPNLDIAKEVVTHVKKCLKHMDEICKTHYADSPIEIKPFYKRYRKII